jgi:hypothetical protein
MSKHLRSSLKFSCGILSIYCLSLAIVPTAYGQIPAPNISTATGAIIASPTPPPIQSFAPASISISAGTTSGITPVSGASSIGGAGTGVTGTGDVATGAKSNETFGINPQANIRNAQALQSQLQAAQASYDSSSARLAQLLAASPTPPAPDNSKLSAVRFARQVAPEGSCGCENPDVVVKPVDNSGAELAAAKEAQAQAQAALDDAQSRARLFLASVDKAPAASAQNTSSSQVW